MPTSPYDDTHDEVGRKPLLTVDTEAAFSPGSNHGFADSLFVFPSMIVVHAPPSADISNFVE
jgi:hypothetical protein